MRAKMSAGFTLIDMMLTLTIMSIVLGFAMPVIYRYRPSADLPSATTTLVGALRRAQTLAEAGNLDSRWGVTIIDQSIKIFTGDNFSSSDPAITESFNLPSDIETNGGEIVFQKNSGLPVSPVTYELTVPSNDSSAAIVINDEGMIAY